MSNKNNRLSYIPYTYCIAWSPEQTGLDHWVKYYGCKYGKNSHPELFWINYFTSSKRVAKKRKEWGEPELIKIRKRFYGLIPGQESMRTVCNYERRVLEFVGAATNNHYLNQNNGGPDFNADTTGTVSVSGTRISRDEFYANRSKYTTPMTGLIPVVAKNTGNATTVTLEEYKTNKHLYQTSATGRVNIIVKSTGEVKNITQEEYKTNNHLYRTPMTGMIAVILKSTGEVKNITSEEYKTNKHLYRTPTTGRVTVILKSTGEVKNITSEEYKTNKHLYQHDNKGKIGATIILTGKRIKVLDTDPRWQSGEIQKGWQ